jgi:hypothetical protein
MQSAHRMREGAQEALDPNFFEEPGRLAPAALSNRLDPVQ